MNTDYDVPIREAFKPLDKLAGPLAPDFMFMGCHRAMGPEHEDIYSYKHSMTRNYVHLDAGGNAFQFRWADDDMCEYLPLPDAAAALALAVDDYSTEETAW